MCLWQTVNSAKNWKRNDTKMLHLLGLFILCCELNVKVLLMAANHGINRPFPAVWWAKPSFGDGKESCAKGAVEASEGRVRYWRQQITMLKRNGVIPVTEPRGSLQAAKGVSGVCTSTPSNTSSSYQLCCSSSRFAQPRNSRRCKRRGLWTA